MYEVEQPFMSLFLQLLSGLVQRTKVAEDESELKEIK